MLVTKREVKQTSKKLLSVLLAFIMMMTSMSVCFGSFSFTASAADYANTEKLAGKLKDGAYADTLGLLAAGKDDGSGFGRKVNITFKNYKNYKQAAELIRLVDAAMRETDAWNTAVTFSGTSGATDQQSGCKGANTADLYDDLTYNLKDNGVSLTTNITAFLKLIYHMNGATAHADDNGQSSLSTWSNTITFSTDDYKGYLAQIGKASAVESSVEMSCNYVVKMQGNLYYEKAGDCGTKTKHYHHQLWPAGTAINAPSTSSTNSEMKSKIDAHIAEINSFTNITYAQWLERVSANTADSRVTEFETTRAKAVTYVGSQSTYDALFADYATAVTNTYASVASAKEFQSYMPTVDDWNAFVAANPDYGVFQYDNFGAAGSETQVKLLEDFKTFKAYRDYLLTGGSIYDYLVDYRYIDETYYTNFYDNVVAYDLQASKDKADTLYNTYKDNYADLETEAQSIIYSELCGYINAIGSYSSHVVNAVYTSGSAYLVDLREALKCEINEAVLYFAENADKTFTTLSTSALWAKIDEAKTKDAALTVLYSEVKANVGEARANELLSAIRASATNMIENLYKTLADRFTLEVNNAYDLYVSMGKPTALKVDSFLKLSAVMVAIEPDILKDLQGVGKAGYITQTTIDRYNELMKVGGIYEIWNAYATTFGFPDYKQTQITYDPRQPMEDDELKVGADPVTEAEMNNLITALDKIITSDLVGDLLGGLLNPDAEEDAEFNLGAMLTDLIKGALFTDDFINTVVQLLYPLVLDEFNKVWATLPDAVPYEGINVTVQYKKSLHNILDEGNFELYPDLLAQKLVDLGYGTKYAENIAILRAAGGGKNAWESFEILDPDTEKLKLTWGVTEQKEKLDAGEITQAQFDKFFYQAFEDATAGLLPLLTTLITNVPWQPAKCEYIATGNATVFIVPVTLNVALQLGSTANQGYANMLVPIYELLGVDYTPVDKINGSTDVAYVLEQILAPIFTFLNTLGEKPVDTLLGILPNLVYALAFRMAKPMLNMLQTQITYDASANIVGSVLADGAEVKVGDMLITDEEDALLPNSMFVGGLNSILEHFGLSIPAIDQATLATLGSLDKVNTNRGAYIYSGLEGTGKAYSITADKADVGYYLLSYLLNVVKDEAALTSLLGLFMTQKDENGEVIKDVDGKAIPDEEKMAGVKKVIYETLNLDEMNVGNVIAAIVELANQVEYPVDGYYWYDGSKSTPIGTTSAAEIYLNPGNDWTEDKAEYLYNNLETLLNSIFSMAGLDLDKTTEEVDGSIEAALGSAINGLFTNKTVTGLAKLLGSLSDLNALLASTGEAEEDANAPETVAEGDEVGLAIDLNKIIKDELGIDLSVYAQYKDLAEDAEINFGVTDAQSFADALKNLLNPLKPVLDFILGGKDLTLIDSAITLHGYKGYDNAIIPLLEALGVAPVAYTEGADTLALTLNALVGVINKLTTNDPAVEKDGTIYTIIDMLPGVIYYLSSNALSQGVDKLLTPVYAVLDTIRPIYNVDLGELLAGIEVDLDKDGVKEPLGLDIKNITWSFIFGLLNDLLGLDLTALQQVIYDVCDDLGVEYTSVSTLTSTWKKGAYSDKFSKADMLTVILSFVLEWATVPANAAKLDELLKTDGIIASLNDVFKSVDIKYNTPNWMYWFESEEAFNAYIESGAGLPNTLASLDWENIGDNDWDFETAQYFAEHIDELVDAIIAMINKDKEDAPKTLAALLSNLVNGLVNAETLNDLVGMIADLLGDIDENLLTIAGYILSDGEGDKIDIVGLKNYECKVEINSISDFINELANVLDTYASALIDWLFFGDDYRFAKKSDNTDTIVINGGYGYEKGLAMILEALGCELPAEANTKSVLGALATRVDAILAAPVDEVLGLLPNLVYFLNANGAGVAVDNLLQPVYALLDKLSAFGLNVNLADLLKFKLEDGTEIAIDLANLSLANVVEIVESATGLPLDAAEAILVDFCTGKITKGEYIYKMDAAREDVITILLVVALELISDDAFAAKLNEMLGVDFITEIKKVFAPSTIEYDTPDWNYAAADNGTVDAMKYSITYPNNWNEETAAYVTDVLLSDDFDKLIAGLIEDGKYETLGDLLSDKVNIFTTKTLEDLLGLIEGFLGGIDESLLELGFILLDVDLNGLMKHEVKADINDVKAFAAELSTILSKYAPGVVEWLLLGRDFKLLVKDADGIEEGLEGDPYITISGAEGYKKGLAILLEALGCENLPAADLETAAIIEGVLTSLANRIDEILSDPIVEVIALLPNLFYFLNTNGVAVAVKNTTAALTALSAKVNVFADINLDVASMVDLKDLLDLPEDAALSMTNLSMAAVLEAVGMLVGLDLTKIEDVLVGFALGKFEAYNSVSGDAEAKRMVYATEFDKHDLVTVVANLVLLALADEANAEFVKGLVGEDIYAVILNVLQIKEAELKKMKWQHTDKVGQSFNAMSSSENYKGYGYGPRYTEEMADYIAENIGEFIDNIIYLLGIEIEGESVDSLEEILKNLVNGNLYNSANIVAIRDALAGFLDKIVGLEVKGTNVGKYIVEVLKKSLDVDISAVAKVEVPEFTENKAQFITYLGKVVDPLGPILNWLLTDEDIAFFAKEGEDGKPTDFIKLPGNAGYKNGIVLLLEALGCKNIVDPADLEGASGSAIVTAIAEPLLDRVDEIINNPAEELLAVLPNLIYFINSNGVDVVVKNTLDAVYTVLNAIEPIAKIDLYELIGLDLEDLTFEKLIDMLLKDLEIAGFKFTEIPMDTFVELTVGKLETYDSLSAEDPAYRMVYDENSASKGDMVTVILRLVITFILTENNREVLINLLKSELGMSADAEKYVAALFKALADCTIGNQLGMDSALATIYYVYYGLDKGVGGAADGKKDLDAAWRAKLKELNDSSNSEETKVGDLITDILDIIFNDEGKVPEDGGNDVLDKDGVASNGFLAFFARIKAFFQEIADFFKNLFSFGK